MPPRGPDNTSEGVDGIMADGRKDPWVLGAGVLHRKPLLIHIVWLVESPFRLLDALSQEIGNTPSLTLVTNYWSILSRWREDMAFDAFVKDYHSHRQRHPHHHVVLIANDSMEQRFIAVHGIETTLFQQSGFLHAGKKPNVGKRSSTLYT